MKEDAKKGFVEIQSTTTINVTKGLQFSNYTDPKAPIANKMNVKPRWVKTSVLIKAGKGVYPKEITEWASVKALENTGVLTIGRDVEGTPEAIQEQVKLEKAEKENSTKATTKKLSEIGE